MNRLVHGKAPPVIKARLQALKLVQALVRDIRGNICFWAQGMEKLYGYTAEEVVGRISGDLLRAEYPRELSDIEAELYERGQWNGELVHHRRDGRRLIVASQWSLWREDSWTGVLEIHSDITELKLVQRDFFSREAHLKSILETIPDAMVVIDEPGVMQSFSRAAQRLFRYMAQEVIGKNVKMLMPAPYNEERRLSSKISKERREADHRRWPRGGGRAKGRLHISHRA
jgi:PAS domain S-box-containing protein